MGLRKLKSNTPVVGFSKAGNGCGPRHLTVGSQRSCPSWNFRGILPCSAEMRRLEAGKYVLGSANSV